MSSASFDIKTFATRVRQLILSNKQLKKEVNDLNVMVGERDKKITLLQQQLLESQKKYDALLAAKMLNVSDDDLANTQKKINQLIHKVNSCITMLSQEHQ